MYIYTYGYHNCSAHSALLVNEVSGHHVACPSEGLMQCSSKPCLSQGVMLAWCWGCLSQIITYLQHQGSQEMRVLFHPNSFPLVYVDIYFLLMVYPMCLSTLRLHCLVMRWCRHCWSGSASSSRSGSGGGAGSGRCSSTRS